MKIKNLKFNKVDPIRDWKIVLAVFTLGLIALSVFAWQIYLSSQIGGGYFGTAASPTDAPVQLIDQKKLQADLILLQNHKASLVKTVDPSL